MDGSLVRESSPALTAEILQEAAEAYFAACRRMVDALGALSAFIALLLCRLRATSKSRIGLNCFMLLPKESISFSCNVRP